MRVRGQGLHGRAGECVLQCEGSVFETGGEATHPNFAASFPCSLELEYGNWDGRIFHPRSRALVPGCMGTRLKFTLRVLSDDKRRLSWGSLAMVRPVRVLQLTCHLKVAVLVTDG